VRVRAGITLAPLLLALAWPAAASANPQQAGIQVALRALGLYCGPIDGIVGPQTVTAVRVVQRRAHLPPTGVIDARTRVAMGPLGTPLFGSRTVRPGDFGLDVAVLQYLLAKRGLYRGALDGYLGKRTAVALRRYQKRTRLLADGVVGPRTRAALVLATGVPVRARIVTVASRTYVVRSGDNLTALARRFGTTLRALAQANHLDPAKPLLIGTRLEVPSASVPARTALASTPSTVRDRLDYWAGQYGVSVHLVRALAWMESGYQPDITSEAGARGVLQTLPTTRAYVEDVLARRSIPHTLDGDIEVGVVLLRHLLDTFGGDERLALAAWYQGERAVRAAGVYQVSKPFVANVLALKLRL
jgi:LysM repeat protein